MRAELVLMNKRIDMAPRARRRALVVAIYAVFAALILACWLANPGWGDGAVWIIWAAIFACRLFLGGYAPGGLIKPFNNKPPRQSDAPPPYLLLKLRAYQPVSTDNSEYLNDERELHQRDHAHYLAYQVLSFGVLIPMLARSVQHFMPKLLASSGMTASQFYYGLGLIAFLLFMTLPQVILLWTEPDMEPAKEFAEER